MFLRICVRASHVLTGLWRPIVLGAWVLAVATAQASPAPASGAALERSTNALVALASRYADAGDGQAPAIAAQMATLAAVRQQQFLQLVQQDASAALRHSLPGRVRERMPADVQDHVEQRLDLSGELTVRYEHWEDRSELVYELATGPERLRLYFAGDPPKAMSGTPVRARGMASGGAMVVSSDGSGLVIMNLDSSGSGGTTSPTSLASTYNTVGDQRTLVLLVNWLDDPSYQPFTVEHAHQLVFGTLSDFVLENSSLQAWVTGEVRGWYTLPMTQPADPYTDCKQTVIATAALEAAASDGVDLAAFDRYIYVFPGLSCMPSGSGTVGGNPSEAWIESGWFQLKTIAHEFGHNLGLYHAGGMDCDLTPLGNDCRVSPYRDILDVMGNHSAGHFSGYNKERLGWLDAASGTIATTVGGGSYTLESFAASARGRPKALKVFKETDPATGAPTWFYIEYRQPVGFDEFVAANDNVLNGLVVRVATDTENPGPISSLLLDMTPGSDSYDDMQDPALPFGSTFSDPGSGLTFSGTRGTGETAIVEVVLGASTCIRSAPSLVILPAEGQWAEAGTTVTFHARLTNNDGAACGAATFHLESVSPAGWDVSFEPTNVTFDAGASTQAIFRVTSPVDAPDGSQAIDVVVTRDGGSGSPVSATAVYVVSGSMSNAAPVAVDDEAQTAQGTPVEIDVLANDSDPDFDPLTITSVSTPSRGSVSFTADGVVIYTPSNGVKEDSFQYTVSDGLARSTATVIVSVQGKSSQDGGGGGKAGGNGNGRNK